MLAHLPTELICGIAEICKPNEQANLALTCQRLYAICIPILYKENVTSYGASSVSYAIMQCDDEQVAIGTLQSAHMAGFEFQQCQTLRGSSSGYVSAPLYLAAIRGLNGIVAFLLDHGACSDGLAYEASPLFGALLAHKENTAVLLVKRGASLQSHMLGKNALHITVDAGLDKMAAYLVREAKMDVNARTKSGETPIMLAILSGKIPMACLLVGLGARIYDALLQTCHRQEFHVALQLVDMPFTISFCPLSRKEARAVANCVLKDSYDSITRDILLHTLRNIANEASNE